jgi:VIT1/CCC1 family predicted Fe2+/Mn2+ transporter
MAAGDYNSMRVQAELLERELSLERAALRSDPQLETQELAAIYEARGMDADVARTTAEAMMADPELALEAHAREELGIDPRALGSPWGASVSSFVAFSLGAIVPLAPWFVGGGDAAVVASLVLAVVAAVVVGLVLAHLTERPAPRMVGRQLAFTLVPAALTYLLGSLVGVGV